MQRAPTSILLVVSSIVNEFGRGAGLVDVLGPFVGAVA